MASSAHRWKFRLIPSRRSLGRYRILSCPSSATHDLRSPGASSITVSRQRGSSWARTLVMVSRTSALSPYAGNMMSMTCSVSIFLPVSYRL